MGTVLISSTSKFRPSPHACLAWGLLLTLLSCGSSHKKAPRTNSELERALKALPEQDAPRAVYGPTNPAGHGFVDRTKEYGLEGIEAVWFGAIDLNRDLHDDLVILTGYFHQPRFFLFDRRLKKFIETSSRLSESMSASYLAFADFDRDGVLDMLAGVLNQRGEFTKLPLTLWKGSWDAKNQMQWSRDNTFLRLSPEPTSSVALIDANLDGRLDIFMGNWYSDHKGSQIPTADRLLMNLPDGWADKSDWLTGEGQKSSNDLFPPSAKPTYGAATCDMDQDGWPDILTASSGGHANKLWLNRAPRPGPLMEGRRFLDVGRESGFGHDANGALVPTGGGRTFTAICADYNDDGIMDAFLGELTHGWDNVAVDRSSILTGARQTPPLSFYRTEYLSDNQTENWNQGDKRASWADLNLDGRVDLVVDNSGFPPQSRLVSFMQDETHAFTNVAPQWGLDIVNPVGTIVMDVNGDGRPDIVTGQSNVRQSDIPGRIYVLENQLKLTGRSRVFYLEGERANGQGIGAMVMLYTVEGTKQVVQRSWNEFVQGGLSSQRPAGVRFGVAAQTQVLGVKVRWPILKGGSGRSTAVVEKMYPLVDDAKKPLQEWTLCEDGRVSPGRFSCKKR